MVNLSEDTAAVLEGEVLRLSGQVDAGVVTRVYDQGLKNLSAPVTEVGLSFFERGGLHLSCLIAAFAIAVVQTA